jgi:hypothetical protein
MQGKAPKHPARLPIHDIDILVARAVAFYLKCRDGVAKLFLECMLRSEYEFANLSSARLAPAARESLAGGCGQAKRLREIGELRVEHLFRVLP